MSQTHAPLYAGEKEPPVEGMQLYQCFYPAVLSGPPLVNDIIDQLVENEMNVSQSTIDAVTQGAICDPAEAARVCLAIAAKIRQEGQKVAASTEYPFLMRELRWAMPEEVPRDDPRFWQVDLHVVDNQEDAAKLLNKLGVSGNGDPIDVFHPE